MPPIFCAMSWAHHLDYRALGEVDMIADVLRYEDHKAQIVAAMIRELEALVTQLGCLPVLVCHSLGSVLMVDVAAELHRRGRGLLWHHIFTFGSPLGVDVPALPGIAYRDRLGPARAILGDRAALWVDGYNVGDPFGTGALFGAQLADGTQGLQSFGYPCESVHVDLGNHPVEGHTGFWKHQQVAQLALGLALGGL